MLLQNAADGLTGHRCLGLGPPARPQHALRPRRYGGNGAPIAGEEPRPTQDESLWSISLLVAPLDLATAPSGTVSPLHVINLEMLKLKQWIRLSGCVDTELRYTLECARSRNDRQDDQHQQNSEQAGLTGAADLSNRCSQGFTKA